MKNTITFLLFSYVFIVEAQNRTEVYIAKYSNIAINEMNKYNIPASITLAQGILESGNGQSRLAIQGNNHFGIKCHDNWNGETIIEDDDVKGECFRKYSAVAESYRDHSLFLAERKRYLFLFEYKITNYKKWARGLKKAGYATNPKYSDLIIDLIDKYNLDRFDAPKDSQKKLYMAHSYGFPYLYGIGCFYFGQTSLYSIEINTSFVFSETNIGYNHKVSKTLYLGGELGVIYRPAEKKDIIPQLAPEILYRKNNIMVRGGVQIPLDRIEYKVIPFLKFTYPLN
tara:strand:- start:36479 stop:37330 length:852 start_codon:yes stop_codon:yes gene_type:complete